MVSNIKKDNVISYRPDIDGLRAVAIISVIMYHAFPSIVKSGFIGVDIFFVISGYLITLIILDDVIKGNFNALIFWRHRIARIFPALIVILLFTLFLGSGILFNGELSLLGKHILAGSSFMSNFLLMNEGSYFDADMRLKPLAHLWSLGVEEQFYLVWPFLVWMTWRLRVNIVVLILFVGIVSFCLNIWFISTDAVVAFYSPQTRVWELMVGATIAWFNINYGLNKFPASRKLAELRPLACNILSILGAFLIFYSVFFIQVSTLFPGWRVLAPTLGAAFIIAAGSKSWFNNIVLSSRVFVWCGLISFSLYLWHWPLLTYLRVIENNADSNLLSAVAILCAFMLAIFSYRYIELPFRRRKGSNNQALVLLISLALTGLIGYTTYLKLKIRGEGEVAFNSSSSGVFLVATPVENHTKDFKVKEIKSWLGLSKNIAMDERLIEIERQKYWSGSGEHQYETSNKRVLIYGDSIAWDIYKSLFHDKNLGLKIYKMGHFCTAFNQPKVGDDDKRTACQNSFDDLLESKELKNADVLIYASYWLKDVNPVDALKTFSENLYLIRLKNPSVKIIFFGPKPLLGKSWISINQIIKNYSSEISMNDYLNGVRWLRPDETIYVRNISADLGVEFIDTDEIFCNQGCTFFAEDKFSYFDQNHWTEWGAYVFFKKLRLEKKYQKIFNN